MERFVSGFLRAALVWLVLGTALGAAMAMHPAWLVYRPVHLHLLLLGFVAMMIAGVAYHVLPRFTATPLHSPRLALVHLVVANVGLVSLAGGFVARTVVPAAAPALLTIGGSLSATGAWMLAWNLWRTLDHAVVPPNRLPRSSGLPVARSGGPG
jgi:cbb3-type cytochrome oxidase subunit 1